eukprot:4112531-Pyramimonas_sp.AAC.1
MEQAAAMLLRTFPDARLSVPPAKLHREPLRLDGEGQSGKAVPHPGLRRRVKVGFVSSQVWSTSEMRHLGEMIKRLSSPELEVVVIHVGDRVFIHTPSLYIHITAP